MPEYEYIGRGVYSVAEAARLTGVPSSTIRRWTRGYTYRGNIIPPVFHGVNEEGIPILRFVDLMEVRVLDGFRKAGVSWPTMRLMAYQAAEKLGHSHPFSRRSFRTDGRQILLDTGNQILVNLINDEQSFKRIVEPFLSDSILDYSASEAPKRWYPMGRNRTVVIDPARSFGAPICSPSGVRTSLLYKGYKAEGEDLQAVSWWYNTTDVEVSDAIEYEERLAA